MLMLYVGYIRKSHVIFRLGDKELPRLVGFPVVDGDMKPRNRQSTTAVTAFRTHFEPFRAPKGYLSIVL